MGKVKEIAEVQRIDVKRAVVKIRGISPLIVHRWAEKAKKEMLDKMMKKTVKKVAKDPEAEYEASKYLLDNGRPGFPAEGFKLAMVRGAKQINLVMTDMRTGFFVHGEYSEKENRELVEIIGDPIMREDNVRVGKGGADLRYRAQFSQWEALLNLSFNASVVSFDHIVNMLNAAGYGVGIGEWRPEKGGMFGRFEIVSEGE